jgi:uncharacterized protein (TIGR02147 family)
LSDTGPQATTPREVQPSGYLDYRLYFLALYQERKQTLLSYSYQKFAADLGFGPTTVMHQIVKGNRTLTPKAAASIASHLGLNVKEKKYLLALVVFCNSKNAAEKAESFEILQKMKLDSVPDELDRDMLSYFSNWQNPVIWELVGTPGFQSDPKWIAKRITPRLKVEQVQESLDLLERIGFIARIPETGGFQQTKDRVITSPNIKGMALVGYHHSMIDHGKATLTSMSGKRRDVSAVTVSVNEETARKLRSMIHAFQLQLLDEAKRSGGGDEVYQINIQLFPFTEPDDI